MRTNDIMILAVTAASLAACQGDEGAGAADNAATGNEAAPTADADDPMASAMSAGPATLTADATFVDGSGKVLREGSNGWTCHAGTATMGPMCNDAAWEAMIGAMMAGEPGSPAFGISYMLAGEGDAPGASNIDPAATEPTPDNQWVVEGPHLMITLPDATMLEGISTDPEDPVYVMWKGTPYAHLMVRISEVED